MFRKIKLLYTSSLEKRPVLTKMVTTGALYGLGDTFAQTITPLITKKDAKFDYKRLLRLSFFGFGLLGPYLHYYFIFLEKYIRLPGNRGVFARLLFDQSIGSLMFCFSFTSYNCLAQGYGIQQIEKDLRANLWNILKANWMVWPLVNFITFKYIPMEQRVLFVNVVAFFWSALLSFLVSK